MKLTNKMRMKKKMNIKMMMMNIKNDWGQRIYEYDIYNINQQFFY